MSSGKQLCFFSLQLSQQGSAYTWRKRIFSLLLELIDKAQQSIHLQTYIFEEDETGKQVATALIKAAQKGERCTLLLDGYASDLSKNLFTS
jgi:cardiolipin synthase